MIYFENTFRKFLFLIQPQTTSHTKCNHKFPFCNANLSCNSTVFKLQIIYFGRVKFT